MADQSETPKILDEIAKKTSSKSGRSRSGHAGFIFLLCLLLPLIGGVAYLGYQHWLLSQDMNQLAANRSGIESIGRIDGIETTVTELQQQTGLLNTRYAALAVNSASINVDQLSNDYAELNATVRQLAEENIELRVSLENQSVIISTFQNQNSQLQQIQTQLAEADPEIVIDNAAALEVEQRLTTRISQLTSQINQLQQQARSQAGSDEEPQFYLSETEHLLRLTNQKLQLDADAVGALSVLQSARQLLITNNAADTDLGRQLEQDQLALENVEVVNIDSIYQRVNDLLPQFNSLVLANSLSQSLPDLQFSTGSDQAGITTNLNAESSGFWDSSVNFLSSVFVWRRWEETPAVTLPAVQDTYTKQNLYLWLEQAKLALLTRNQDRFQESIANCEAWLSHYMVAGDAQSQNLLAELESLAAINIRPELPVVSSSLTLVRQLIQQSKQ